MKQQRFKFPSGKEFSLRDIFGIFWFWFILGELLGLAVVWFLKWYKRDSGFFPAFLGAHILGYSELSLWDVDRVWIYLWITFFGIGFYILLTFILSFFYRGKKAAFLLLIPISLFVLIWILTYL